MATVRRLEVAGVPHHVAVGVVDADVVVPVTPGPHGISTTVIGDLTAALHATAVSSNSQRGRTGTST